MLSKKTIRENLWKNLFLTILLVVSYPLIRSELVHLTTLQDSGLAGNLLVAISIIAVTACFGNFAYTYERVKVSNPMHRYLAHITTGTLMLVMGMSLIYISILIREIIGKMILLDISLIILYLGCVIFDFWDVFKLHY